MQQQRSDSDLEFTVFDDVHQDISPPCEGDLCRARLEGRLFDYPGGSQDEITSGSALANIAPNIGPKQIDEASTTAELAPLTSSGHVGIDARDARQREVRLATKTKKKNKKKKKEKEKPTPTKEMARVLASLVKSGHKAEQSQCCDCLAMMREELKSGTSDNKEVTDVLVSADPLTSLYACLLTEYSSIRCMAD